MPVEPLPDDVVARLRSDPTAALAAAVVVAGAFPGIVSWAARAFCGSSNAGRPGDAGGGGDRSNDEDGGGTSGSNGASGKHGEASPGRCHIGLRRAREVYALRIFKPPRRPHATWSSPRRVARGVI